MSGRSRQLQRVMKKETVQILDDMQASCGGEDYVRLSGGGSPSASVPSNSLSFFLTKIHKTRGNVALIIQ